MNAQEHVFSMDGFKQYDDRLDGFRHDVARSRVVDAIIVPQGRSAPAIGRAALLARKADATLISLCSHDANAKEVGEYLEGLKGQAPLRWYAVDMPEGYRLPNAKLRAQETIPLLGRKGEDFNLPQKRNVGLAIGKMLNSEKIFFHDDDLRLSIASLEAVMKVLYKKRTAGLQCNGMPDRSVIQHAKLRLLKYHMAGRHYSTYEIVKSGQVSGNSLAVNPQTADGMNPEGIYNEDIIYAYPDYTIGLSGMARDHAYVQDIYNPYQAKRAAEEEFGDIFADGLYRNNSDHDLFYDPEYWQNQIEFRHSEHEWLMKNVGATRNGRYFSYLSRNISEFYQPMPEEDQEEIKSVLMAGLAVRETLQGEDFVDYMYAWEDDRRAWNAMRDNLPTPLTVDEALAHLALNSYVTNA